MKILTIVVGLLWCLGFIGYGMNAYKFLTSDFEEPYKKEVIHGVGLIPIFGAFTGYMTFEDGKEVKDGN